MINGTYLSWPADGDRGSVFCPAIADNFETLDSHNHDGANSGLINSKSIAKATTTLSSSSWIDTGVDYKQLVTLSGGYSFDTTLIKAIINSGTYSGMEFTPSINKVSPTSFYLHCMFGDVDVKVVLS